MKNLTMLAIVAGVLLGGTWVALGQSASPAPQAQGRHWLFLNTQGHTAGVKQILFTPDQKHIISVGMDKAIRIWTSDDTGGYSQTGVLYGQVADGVDGQLFCAALNKQGTLLAVAGATHIGEATNNRYVIRLLHIGNLDASPPVVSVSLLGATRDSKPHGDIILGLAFAPDGHRLASVGADTGVRIWDTDSGSCRLLSGSAFFNANHQNAQDEHSALVSSLAWSPDGDKLVTGSFDRTIRIWDVNADPPQSDVINACEAGHSPERVTSVAWSPQALDGGKTIAIGTVTDDSQEGNVYLLPVSGRPTLLCHENKPVSQVAFSPSGSILAVTLDIGTGGPSHVDLWSMPSRSHLRELDGHENGLYTEGFSPDSSLLATGDANGQIDLWNLANTPASPVVLGEPAAPAEDLQWSADGTRLRWSENGTTFVYDCTRAVARPADGDQDIDLAWEPIQSGDGLSLSNDKQSVATSDGTNIALPNDSDDTVTNKQCCCILRTPEGTRILLGSLHGYVYMYDATGNPVKTLKGPLGAIESLGASPANPDYVAAASADRTVSIWNLAGESSMPFLSVYAEPSPEGCEYVAWAPASGYYTCSPNGQNLLGWVINKGDDQMSHYETGDDEPAFYTPSVMRAIFQTGDINSAVTSAGLSLLDIAGFEAPTVQLNDPDLQTYSTSFTLNVSVLRGKQPLDHLEVYVNGRKDQTADLGQKDTANLSLPIQDLLPGQKNSISVLAVATAGADGTQQVGSAEETVQCYAPKPPAAPPALNILAIGIRDYRGFVSLQYPDADAKSIAAAFQRQTSLFSSINPPIILLNDKATKGGILSAIDELCNRKIGPDDYTVIFIAGHAGASQDNSHYYLLPYDVIQDPNDIHVTPEQKAQQMDGEALMENTSVDLAQLYDRISKIPGHVILLLDTCHSGGTTLEAEDNDGYSRFTTQLTDRWDRGTTAVITFASCGPAEESEEKTEWGHGAFTKAILDALSGEAPDGHDNNGQVTVLTLETYVSSAVAAMTQKSQWPHPLGASNTSDDLVLAKVQPTVQGAGL